MSDADGTTTQPPSRPLLRRAIGREADDTAGIGWFVAAAALGLLHAAASWVWAFGGTLLVETTGSAGREVLDLGRPAATLVLIAVAGVKTAAALVPVWSEWRRPRSRPFWRVLTWIGAVVLVVWGAYGIAGGALQLAGVIVPTGGVDVPGAIGHAFLWDPLFLAWGVLLLIGLSRSRRRRDGARTDAAALP